MTKADHLGHAGRSAPEPEIPIDGRYLWDWFWELSAGRSYGMIANPISYIDVAAWSALVGATPSEADVRALKHMDAAFLAAMAKKQGG